MPQRDGGRALGTAFWLAVAWLAAVVLGAVLADVLPLADPNHVGVGGVAEGPSLQHPLGTDELGRDELARVLHGARISLSVGVAAVGCGLVVGGVLGLLAGYFRGAVDAITALATDAMLSFPYLIFALAAVSFVGRSLFVIILTMGIGAVAPVQRVVRASTVRWRQRDFVLAAQLLGAKTSRVLGREILANVAPAMLAYTLVAMAFAIVIEGALSFLGLSVRPPAASWGSMVGAGAAVMERHPALVVWPSIVLFLTVLALNLAGDRLQRRFAVQEGRL